MLWLHQGARCASKTGRLMMKFTKSLLKTSAAVALVASAQAAMGVFHLSLLLHQPVRTFKS
ncbi:MAG: hypothetical protein EBX04_07495 [Rhodobacteraceae bacterium]|nr:hypothetical protein [Paracoccaceae bacterium]